MCKNRKIKKARTIGEHRGDMEKEQPIAEHGEDEAEEDVYSDEGVDKLVDDEEITPAEAGFIRGTQQSSDKSCARCGKPLGDEIIEREVDGEIMQFCSEKCADAEKER